MLTKRPLLVAVSAIMVTLPTKSFAFSGLQFLSLSIGRKLVSQVHPQIQKRSYRRGATLNDAVTPPNSDKGPPNAVERAVTNLLQLLWKGITLPFPMLRGMANDSTDSGFTLSECLMAIAAYLGTGVLAYSVFLEKWSVVDALYFSVVSFTTVGYGDVCPSNVASKYFTCLYGLGGVVILGAVISTIGTRLINAEVEAIQAAEKASRQHIMSVLDAMPTIVTSNRTRPKMVQEKREPVLIPSWKQNINGKLMETVINVLSASSVLIFGGLVMGRLEGWQWRDSLYYSFITAGTLGFGDFSPKTNAGRIWAIAFIPLAVAAAGEVLGNVAAFLTEQRQKEAYERALHRELTMDYLLQLDANGDGTVSRDEYIQGMLVELRLVDAQQLQELNEQFDRLDITENGTLDKDDLKLASQIHSNSVKRPTQ